MRELFIAPDAVMAYLCKQYRVHDIPIGSARTKEVVGQVRYLRIEPFVYVTS